MENAVVLGILYIIIGSLLLFFGWRFIKLVVGLYGFLTGLWLGEVIVDMFNISGSFATLAIQLLVAISLAVVAVTFYTFVLALMLAFLVFSISYGIMNGLTGEALPSLIIAILAGIIGYIAIRRYELVSLAVIIISAIQGAGAVAAGIAILLDHSRAESLLHGYIAIITNTASAPWIIGWIALALIGFITQWNSWKDSKQRTIA